MANAEIAGSARLHAWDGRTPVPFLCECDNEECQEHVRMTLSEYDELGALNLFLIAPGHGIDLGTMRAPRVAFG